MGATANVSTLVRDTSLEDFTEVGTVFQIAFKQPNPSVFLNNMTVSRVTSVRTAIRGNGYNLVNIGEANGARLLIWNSNFSQFNVSSSDGKLVL